MKYTAAILAFAASALAFSSPHARQQTKRDTCTSPGTYRCATDATTMEVCDFDGAWKRLVPGCPSGTHCQDNAYGNNIPYCVAAPVPPNPIVPGSACTVQAQYSCYTDKATGRDGIQICDIDYKTKSVGLCPVGNHCGNIAGIPYCLV